MGQISYQDEIVLQRQSANLENLVKVAASYQDTNKVLFDECMKEAGICQGLIDLIKDKKAA